MTELLQKVKEPSPQYHTGYQSRWVKCREHDEEYLEVWVPSLELWTAATGCLSCQREKETGQRQPRRGQTMQELKLESAGIPQRFRTKTLKDFPPKAFKEALEIARSFAAGDDLLIVGPLAAGKTSFACCLLAQPWALELENGPEYRSSLTAMESLWAASQPTSWQDGGYCQSLTDILQAFDEPGLLVLDDIQDIRTAEEVAWLQRILGARHRQKRGTILVGGPDLETLEATLGTRTLDELRGWKLLQLGKE